MNAIQLFINLVLFFWLLALTALVVRWRWDGAGQRSSTEMQHFVEQVEDSQRLIQAMSEDFLSLSQQMLREIDDLRLRVAACASQTSARADFSRAPFQPTGADQALHPALERYRDLYQRAAAGQSVTTIARELGMGKGEVELVLTLGQQAVTEPNAIRHKS